MMNKANELDNEKIKNGPAYPFSVNNQLIGNNLRFFRKMRNNSMVQLADVLGISYQQVQKYEKGSSQISALKLYKIANYLKVPIGMFFANPKLDYLPEDQRHKTSQNIIWKM